MAKIATAENTYPPVSNVAATSLIPANTVLVQFLRLEPKQHTVTIRPAKQPKLFQAHYLGHKPEASAINSKTARDRIIAGMQYYHNKQEYAEPATITLAIQIAEHDYPADLALIRAESIANWITSGDEEVTKALTQRAEVFFGKARPKPKFVPPYDPFEL